MRILVNALLLIFVIFIGCNKEAVDNEDSKGSEAVSYSEKIVLAPLAIKGDSIVVSWSKLTNDKFENYHITRQTWLEGQLTAISYIDTNSVTKFVEKTPLSPFVKYQIVGNLSNGEKIESNIEVLERPELKLSFLSATKNGDSIHLSWQKLGYGGVSSYRVMRKQSKDDVLHEIARLDKTRTTYIDTAYSYGPEVGYMIIANFDTNEWVVSNELYVDASAKITLEPVRVSDKSIMLSWTPIRRRSFVEYKVVRTLGLSPYYDVLATITNPSQTIFVDNAVPYHSYVSYSIIAEVLDDRRYMVTSNPKSYSRPEIKSFISSEHGSYLDVLPDPDNNSLLFFDRYGRVSVYDVANAIFAKTIDLNESISFPALGIYNGMKELYVPTYSGKVLIFNAKTLEKITEINTGNSIRSVAQHNGRLYIFYYFLTAECYSRADNSKISYNNIGSPMAVKMIPGSDVKLFGLDASVRSVMAMSMSFDGSNGTLLSTNSRAYQSMEFNPYIFEVYPDGKKIITSARGHVFSVDGTYLNSLSSEPAYTGFAFDKDADEMYACTVNRYIEVFSITTGKQVKMYKSQLYPMKIVKLRDKLVCIGTLLSQGNNFYSGPKEMIIEVIPI
jgi:hypothetical protein